VYHGLARFAAASGLAAVCRDNGAGIMAGSAEAPVCSPTPDERQRMAALAVDFVSGADFDVRYL
jgi:hypothetical protein